LLASMVHGVILLAPHDDGGDRCVDKSHLPLCLQ